MNLCSIPFVFAFWEINFSDFWGPQKLKFRPKSPKFWTLDFLTFITRRWGDFSKNIALYLTVPLCCSKIALSQDLGVVYYCFLLKGVDEYGNEKRQNVVTFECTFLLQLNCTKSFSNLKNGFYSTLADLYEITST